MLKLYKYTYNIIHQMLSMGFCILYVHNVYELLIYT